jgi:NAD(P)-dependent dehydrogenase (short-subunit alcohol dehydrogenase family)
VSGFKVDLKGRTTLITGASSGLGARFGRLFAESGANVVLTARRVEKLEEVRREIDAMNGRAIAVAMDVTDEASVVAAFDEAERVFGAVDSVIANAGMSIDKPVLEMDAATIDEVMAVNFRGVFLTAREGARRMIEAGSPTRSHGRIVLVSSITAYDVTPNIALYSASKAAVLQLGRVLARDWCRHGINVNVVCPGYIETEINADWFKTERGAKHIASWPRKRLMDPDALDLPILYLTSDSSRQVTGSVFSVDDGQTL